MTDTTIDPTPPAREVFVIDTETTGLHPGRHLPVEVAAISMRTGQRVRFVPFLPANARSQSDPHAFRVNRYYERGLFTEQLSRTDTINAYRQLFDMLAGNTIAGANVRFDAAMLMAGYSEIACLEDVPDEPDVEPWHFRLAELGPYAAGCLGTSLADLDGLDGVCRELGVTNAAPHTALGDAEATVACFQKLGMRP